MVTIFLSAFLASAAFEPIGIWFLAIIGFALFFRKLTISRSPVIQSFIFGFVLNAIVLHWTGKFVGSLPWLILCFLQALFYLPIGLIYKRTSKIWLAALVLLLMEEFRSRFPFGGFGWTRIAFSQVDSPALPVVAIGGVTALSAFTIFIALLVARPKFKTIFFAALFIGLSNFLPVNPQGVGSIRAIGIQGNTPEVGLEFNSRAKAVFDLHRDATREFASGEYDVIVWPENAIDIDPRLNPDVAADISSLTKELGAPLIAGVVQRNGGNPENASIMYSSTGESKSVYIKRGLTPFGEYIPLRGIAEFVSPYANRVLDFKPGVQRVVHDVNGSRIGPIVCYEIINDHLVRDMAKYAQALIVQTNSATFANTPQSRQQLSITRIRAAEHSRYILSISTVGISAFIDNNGQVLRETAEGAKSALIGDLLLSKYRTPIDRLLK